MLFARLRLRTYKWPALAACLFLATTLYLAIGRKNSLHVLKPDLYREHNIGPSDRLLLPDRTTSFCQAHGFRPLDAVAASRRKVYDLFLLSTELDWLEIRLHTLSPYVDYFVIVESATTFTGLPKPLYLSENWDKFTAFHRKIIYRVVDDPGPSIGRRTRDHEDYMRNAMFDVVFPELVGKPQEAHDGDVLIVSDIDEIPKPETLVVLRMCDFPLRLTLRSHFYYYSFQWQHRGELWAHPQATVYRGLDNTISPKDLRNGEGEPGWFFLGYLRTWLAKSDFWESAWHCSSCFMTVKEMQTKMESASHGAWNTPKNRDPEAIVQRVRHGVDLFGRPSERYDRVDNNIDVPAYVSQHKARFGYLLDRDGWNAAFTDYVNSSRVAPGEA